MDQDTRAAHYLALLALPRLGPVAVYSLRAAAGGLERLVTTHWSAKSLLLRPDDKWEPPSERELRLLRGLPARVSGALPAAKRALAEAAAAGLEVITLDDGGYPPALRLNLSGPPPVLFVEGVLPAALSNDYERLPACAVVGTRRASRFSLTFAKDLARGLAELGVVVVSGLALGIDAAAHAGALEGARLAPGVGGGTVAVLGGGHQRFHPVANRSLAAAIVASGGAVVSEWPPAVDPAPHQFLQRNRVISGLSRAVVIVEAGERSGAINTSSHALTQARDVLVVPGRPEPAMAGNLALLRDGAKPLIDIADLEATFARVPGIGPALASLALVEAGATGGTGGGPGPSSEHAATLPARVHTILQRRGESTVDQLLAELAEATGPPQSGAIPTTVASLTAALLELELSGGVEAGRNGRYHARVAPSRARSASARLAVGVGRGRLDDEQGP